MPYSQFTTLRAIKKSLSIDVKKGILFEPNAIKALEPSSWLSETLTNTLDDEVGFYSEKSRSEAIVFPVLIDIKKRNKGFFSLYSGATIEADKEKGLNGECDFILSLGMQSIEVETPIFCVVEAKDNDIDVAIPQCIAQMKGSLIFNELDSKKIHTIYGCVTTGEIWQFLKLTDNEVCIDNKRYYLHDMPHLLGILQYIVDLYK